MNEIVNTFLLVGDKFMPERHFRQVEFTYSACGLFTKNKERIRKLKETEDSRYIYQNELDNACFQHNIAYGDLEDLNRRTFPDKVSSNKAINFAKDPKYYGYQRGLVPMVYRYFDKKTSGSGIKIFVIKN